MPPILMQIFRNSLRRNYKNSYHAFRLVLLQLFGALPQTVTGALPLEPTGGLLSVRLPDFPPCPFPLLPPPGARRRMNILLLRAVEVCLAGPSQPVCVSLDSCLCPLFDWHVRY